MRGMRGGRGYEGVRGGCEGAWIIGGDGCCFSGLGALRGCQLSLSTAPCLGRLDTGESHMLVSFRQL
jgi:hypothetical protein